MTELPRADGGRDASASPGRRADVLQWIAELGVHVAAMLLVVIMLAVVVNSALRWLGAAGTPFVVELAGYGFLTLTFLGAASTLVARSHVAVELISGSFGPKVRRLLVDFAMGLVGIVYVALLMWACSAATLRLYFSDTRLAGSTTIVVWPLASISVIGCGLLLLALFRQVIFAAWPREAKRDPE